MSGKQYAGFGALVIGIAALIVLQKSKKPSGATHDASPSYGQGAEAPLTAEGQHHRDAKVRKREGKFGSLEDAETALLGFDLSFIRSGKREDAETGIYRLRNLVARIPDTYYGELIQRVGEGNSKDLSGYMLQMAIYQEWGRMDLDAALRNLPRMEDPKLREKALHNAFVGAADTDAPRAMSNAKDLDFEMMGDFSAVQRIDLMDSIFDFWIESDPDEALEWAKEADVSDKRRKQWIDDGLRAWSSKDPAAAERWRKQEH